MLTLSAPEAAVDAALRGVGIAQVSMYYAWRHLHEGCLRMLLPDEHVGGDRELALQYPHRALVAPRVRVTVEYLLEQWSAIDARKITSDELRRFAA